MIDKNYLKLSEIFEQYYLLSKINSSPSWDMQVVMPKKGFAIREKQLTLLSQISDKLLTDDAKKSLEDCDPTKLDEFQKRNFELMTKMINRKNAIP